MSEIEDVHSGVKNGYVLPKSVGIVYSEVKRKYFPTEQQYITEKDAVRDANLMAKYFKRLGLKVFLYMGNADFARKLQRDRPEVVVNLVGSVKGNEFLAATIPAVLELLEIPYTGAEMLGEALNYNKFLVKNLLQQNGIPVPNYQLFNTAHDQLNSSLRFPLISKLNEIHGRVELTQDAVSENEKHLRDRIRFLVKTYGQSVIVEEFIVGKEITVFLLEGLNKKVYMAEKVFKDSEEKFVFATFESEWVPEKWDSYEHRLYKDDILKEYIKKAFEATKMSDYGKFDVRIDVSGRYFFLDANANPYLGPPETSSSISFILSLYGVSYLDVLKRLLINTMRVWEGKKLLSYQ